MHRIDTPGATVDNKFTDGDPVGGIPATLVDDEWLNAVQEELMSILSAGGVAPVKGTQNQVLRAIRTVASGVVGQTRNIRMSCVTASAVATITADEIIVESSLGGTRYCLSSFNKQINLAVVGAGGMDIGPQPTGGFVAIYAIYNPTSNLSSLLAVNATALAAPEVYGGTNLPSGYTASALVCVWPLTGSLLAEGLLLGRDVSIATANALSTLVPAASITPLSIVGVVPKNAISIDGFVAAGSTLASTITMKLWPSTSRQIGEFTIQWAVGTITQNSSFSRLKLVSPQAVGYLQTSTAGSPSFQISITGYSF